MSIQIQRRGGTTAETAEFIGASREISIDTDKNIVVVHDGETAGGTPMAREDMDNVELTSITNIIGPIINDLTGFIFQGPLDSMAGFLLCDGSAISRTDYAGLFAVIGETFGVGDGTSTFNVPDYRDAFLRGMGDLSASDFATNQLSAAPNITGNSSSVSGYSGGGSGAISVSDTGTGYGHTNDWYERRLTIYFYASNSSSVYGRDSTTEVRPTNYAINFFIKY